MLTDLKGTWTLVLGASSGFGRAIVEEVAARGGNVLGVHFDTADKAADAAALADRLSSTGVTVQLHNLNAASPATRREVIAQAVALTGEQGVRVLVHSLAFGSLGPLVPVEGGAEPVTAKQLAMTADVMAHSLVHWVRDLVDADQLRRGAKIFAMTSTGSTRVLAAYGPVSAAKAALEAHARQLAVELAPRGIAVNALRAGTTRTPALDKIPGSEEYARRCRESNPHQRLTTPQDVAEAVVLLSMSDSSWITGNTIGVDGGEALTA